MRQEAKPDAVVERMVFLARQLGTKAPDSSREQRFVATLSERAAAQRALHTRRRQVGVLAVFAAAALGPLAWLKLHSEPRLSYRISGGSATQGNIVGEADTRVAFSDGSRLDLT